MTERKLKHLLGIFLVASHFTLILLCLALYAMAAFRLDELTTILAIVVPVVAGYTTSVVAFFISDRHTFVDETKRVNGIFAAVSFVPALIIFTVIAASIFLKAYNQVFANFEDFKRVLLLIESFFAIYAG